MDDYTCTHTHACGERMVNLRPVAIIQITATHLLHQRAQPPRRRRHRGIRSFYAGVIRADGVAEDVLVAREEVVGDEAANPVRSNVSWVYVGCKSMCG